MIHGYTINNIILQSKRLLMKHLQVNVQFLNHFLHGDAKSLQRNLVQDQQLLHYILMIEYFLVT